MNNQINELSKDELLEQIKNAANMELYYNVDDEENSATDTEILEQDKKKVLDDFSKFTRLIRKYKKTQAELNELALLNKDNVELQRYIKLLDKLDKLNTDIDTARKGYLYESAVNAPSVKLENSDVKVTVVLPYDKIEFDKEKFIEQNGQDEYDKYTTYKSIKGSLKYKIL